MKDNKWSYKPLSALCEINLGNTPSRSRIEFWGKGYSWVSISDLKGKYISKTKEEITDTALSEANCKIVKKGTLLMSFKLSIGKLAFAEKDLYTNEAIVALPIKNELEIIKDYLYYVLKYIPLLGGNQAAMGQTLNKQSLSVLQIPLPSTLDDQRRISKVLSQCEDLIEKRKESLELLEQLLRSAFLEMFWKANPSSHLWEINEISSYALDQKASMRSGPFGSSLLHSEFKDKGEVKVLGIDNVVKNHFHLGKPRFISEAKFSQLKRYQVFPNDVLISIMATNGRSAVVPENIGKAINTKHLAAISLNIEKILPYYLKYSFQFHPSILSQLSNRLKGAIMSGLNLTIIKELKLPKPPIEIQEKFTHIVNQYFETKSHYETSLRELENLYGSMSKRVFCDELDLSKVDISDMDDSVIENLEEKQEDIKLPLIMNEVLSDVKGDGFYLSKKCQLYIEKAKQLRDMVGFELERPELLNFDSFKGALTELNNIGKEVHVEVKDFTPWQIDQHRSVERFLQFFPENIVEKYSFINLFSRNVYEYEAMTLDEYVGVPQDIIAQYGSMENSIIDISFFFKKYFSNRSFQIQEVKEVYDRVVYERGEWFKYEEMKEFIFRALEGDDNLLTQEFETKEIIDEETGDKKLDKQIFLKVLS
jgi:type I restriction enzyme, S subunit